MLNKFLIFIILIYGSLFSGYAIKNILPKLSNWNRPLSRNLMIFISPIISLNSLWSLKFQSKIYWLAPIIYTMLMLSSLIPAYIYSKINKLKNHEKGSLISSALFSNTGITLGGFICYLLYGEEGLYFSSLYISSFLPFYYLVAFPMMNHYSSTSKISIKRSIIELFTNPTSLTPITFIIIGTVLNLLKIHRPFLLNYVVTHILIYISTVGYSFSIGLGMHIGKSLKFTQYALFIAFVKFIYNPIIAYILLNIFGFSKLGNLTPFRVIMVESFMPAAIMSVVLVKLFNLNEDLANASWLITNIIAIAVFPIIILLQTII